MTVMLRTFLLSIAMGLFILTCFSFVVHEFQTGNDITPDPALQEVYDNYTGYLGDTKDTSEAMQAGLEGSIGPDELASEGGVISRIYSTIKLPFEQLKVVQSTMSKTSEALHAPSWMYYALLGMVITLLVAIFIGIVSRSPT